MRRLWEGGEKDLLGCSQGNFDRLEGTSVEGDGGRNEVPNSSGLHHLGWQEFIGDMRSEAEVSLEETTRQRRRGKRVRKAGTRVQPEVFFGQKGWEFAQKLGLKAKEVGEKESSESGLGVDNSLHK